MLTPEEHEELKRLVAEKIAIRAIAKRLGRDPKTIRRALGRARPTPPPSKLEPFRDLARDLYFKGCHAPRILREIRARDYTGGLTILKDFLRALGPRRTPKGPFRRFETRPGVEAQSDWSPYRVSIAGVETVIHAFALVLCFSRRYFVMCFRNERLPTLLWAHQEAFQYHGGVTREILYDNQTAISLGRLHGKPLFHPTFLDFTKAYGFTPIVGIPKKKERLCPLRDYVYLGWRVLLPRGEISGDSTSPVGIPRWGARVARHRRQRPRARDDAPAHRRGVRRGEALPHRAPGDLLPGGTP
jgi:transposase